MARGGHRGGHEPVPPRCQREGRDLVPLLLIALLVLAGCPSEPEPEPPYLAPPEDSAAPSLTPDEVEEAAADAIAALLAVETEPVWTASQALLAGADDSCPSFFYAAPQEGVDVRQWIAEECTSADGVTFEGIGAEITWTDAIADEFVVNGWSVRLGGTISDGATTLTSPGGAVTAQEVEHPEFPFWLRQWELGGIALGDDELALTLQWQDRHALPVDDRSVTLDGSVAALDGPVDTVVFDGVTWLGPTLAGNCRGEPAGTISFREPAGWWDVVFHGKRAVEDDVDAARCDGCGDAWFDGVLVGRVCVDLTPMLGWDDAPW